MEDAQRLSLATRFLKTGRPVNLPESELADACDKVIQATTRVSIKKGLSQARRYSQLAKGKSGVLQLSSWRVLARLTHMSGDYREAFKAYQKARRLAANEPLVRARIDRALVDVQMYLGKLTAARQAAMRSIATFRRHGAASDLAMSRVNYANLLHRQDKHRDAERLYRLAAEYFETTPNRAAVARCLYNRANTLVQLFELDTAEEVYARAVELWDLEGYRMDACDVRYGQAWLKMLRGELHTALLGLTDCERQYRDAGNPKGEALCSLDRAEAYLNLAMYPEALEAGRKSKSLFGRLGLRYEKAKAALFRAQAAFALGSIVEARTALSDAYRGFLAEKNAGFLGAVCLQAAELEGLSTRKGRVNLLAARRWFGKSQLAYWKALGDLKLLHWSAQVSKPLLTGLERNPAVKLVPQLYSFWQTSLGDRAFEEGKEATAREHWGRAADRIDSVRAQLPPVELRTAYARHDATPHSRLVKEYVKTDPMLAACWSERFRTVGLWAPIGSLSHPGRQQVEDSLAALAQRISYVVKQPGLSGQRSRTFSPGAHAQLVRLQQQARESLARLEETTAGSSENSIEYLSSLFVSISHSLPIVQFHVDATDILAFVHENGQVRSVRFERGAERLASSLERWRFLLEGELYRQQLDVRASLRSETELWESLGEWLWSQIELNTAAGKVLILPAGELANVPWPALQHGRGRLGDMYHFVMAPSLRHYVAAQQVVVGEQVGTIFCGAAPDLHHVKGESVAVTSHLGSSLSVVNPCMRGDWPSEGASGIWHYIGHAEHRTDNPFYSFLMLEDGPLFAADFRLKQCQVGLVTLSACRCAEQVTLPGEEPTGLVRSLLEMGARTVVAARWPVSDEATAQWMEEFYRGYSKGAAASEAAGCASQYVREHNPSATHWAAFAVYGADSTWRST